MATILVVDDRPTNREFLRTLLGYQSHRVLEANDGAEALALVKSARPDLVISDILMPTMDGYEFVHQLRADPVIAGIPVIFNTAHYLDREARALAEKSGVSHIIHKPAEPEAVLRAVSDVLGLAPAAAPLPTDEVDSGRDDRRVPRGDEELKFVNERLAALIELGYQLAVERNPESLLENFCRSARKIIGAKYAVVGVLGDRTSLRYLITSGMRPGSFSDAGDLPVAGGLFLKLLKDGKALRFRNVHDHPTGIGVPKSHPEMRSFLGTSISSPAGIYGAFYLGEKIGLGEFTKEDEELAVALAAQLGVTYENVRRFEEVKQRTAELTEEIAERRRAEGALRASEERFSKAFSASPIPMSIVSHNDGRYIDVNESFLENSGFAREEIIGHTTEEIGIYAHPGERERLRAVLEERGRIRNAEVHRRVKSGEVRVALTSSELIEIDGVQCVLTANNDITDRKEAERELAEHALKLSTSEEALRAKNQELQTMSGQLWHAAKLATVGELAASIAHELNNPLATVSLRVDSLLSQTEEDDPKHRSLSIVGEEVERMGNLVANLLQFSRRKESQVSTIDIHTEVASTLELFHNHLRNRNINVAMEFAPDAQMVQADRQQLRQVFLNVLTNAADAMPDGGTLTIRGVPCNLNSDTALRIEFADTGVGIAEQDLPKVTEPFFTTKPEGKGTGLGLAICKRIVQEHRGRFDITSEVGNGTTVRIVLPVSASREDSELIGGNGLAASVGL
jgi:PAS domain S-box-containing protein